MQNDGEDSVGLRDLVNSWIKYQDQLRYDFGKKYKNSALRNLRKEVVEKIYSLLPDPPEPPLEKMTPFNGKSFKKEIKKDWKNTLNKKNLKIWNMLTHDEQALYLFEETKLGEVISKYFEVSPSKKVFSKKEEYISTKIEDPVETKAVRKIIQKEIRKNTSKKWDFKKIDWDIT